jgi:hypothetical protein
MKNILKLLLHRSIRSDNLKPKTCFAKNYYIENDTRCDCKIWCKFPPKGNTPIMTLIHDIKKHTDEEEIQRVYGYVVFCK